MRASGSAILGFQRELGSLLALLEGSQHAFETASTQARAESQGLIKTYSQVA